MAVHLFLQYEVAGWQFSFEIGLVEGFILLFLSFWFKIKVITLHALSWRRITYYPLFALTRHRMPGTACTGRQGQLDSHQ